MILLVTGSSTEPTLFHAGCKPSLHVGLLQCLYLTLSQNGLPSTYIWPWEEHIQHYVRKARQALTFDYERNQSSHICQKGLALTSSGMIGHTIYYPRKGSTLIFDHVRNQSILYIKRALHLHSTMQGTNPIYMSKGLYTYIQPCEEPIQPTCQKGYALTSSHARNQSIIHVRRALSPRMRIPSNWPGSSIFPKNGIQHLYLIM